MRRFSALLFLGLAACVAEGPSTAGLGYIEVSSGGSFNGSYMTRVFADDRVETVISGPFGENTSRKVTQGRAGVFEEVSAVVAAEGPAVAAKVDPGEPACLDYGADAVRADPPIKGFSGVSAACLNKHVDAFQSRILGVIAGR